VVVDRDVNPARLLNELRDLVRAEIAAFAAPRQIVIVESLPRTALGKVRRDQLGSLRGQSAGV
jgi:acyl-coenzyme A synthetase/AMP-(fatty) acid ligase